MLKRLLSVLTLTSVLSLSAFAGEWVSLFDGKSLDGWKAAETPEAFTVANGELKVFGKRGHLFYMGKDGNASWTDFEVQLEVKTTAGANSGFFIHTGWQESGWPSKGYECQVNATHTDPKKTGSLYNVVNVNPAPNTDDQWFTYNITVKGKHVVIKVDDKVVVDYTEKPEDVKGDRKFSSGTFAIQAHDPKSVVFYRNIKARAL
jgi:Domain of Unknown Function (DUF1080)